MYYEKLEKLYNESDLSKDFDIKILDDFDNFIRDEIQHGYQYLNPYKFALDFELTVESSIKIFLTFTDDDKILRAEPFVDCINCPGKSLQVNTNTLLDNDNYIFCEDCGNYFHLDQIKRNIYIYFKLNDNIFVPENKQPFDKVDPNSTYDLLNRLNGNLKVKSPSASVDIEDSVAEGAIKAAAKLDEIKSYNHDTEGNPLSSSVSRLEQDLMNSFYDSVIIENA